MTLHKEHVIRLEDLRYVCIECSTCRTRVILDMQEKSKRAEEHNIFAPKKCPGCYEDYDTAIQQNIDQFQKAYRALLPIGKAISFRGEPKVIGEEDAN